MALSYPTTLPGPTKALHTPRNRVSGSDVPGPASYGSRERDYTGTMDVEFFFTSDQAAIFYLWWRDELLSGGRFFNCTWPALRPGGLTAQFLTEPGFGHVYNGAHRIPAKVQVRGASEAVSSYSDPYFSSVAYLLSFDNPASPYAFPDAKGNVWTRELTGAPNDFLVTAALPKFGSGSLLMRPKDTTAGDFTLIATSATGDYSLGTGNKYTLEGWLYLATTPSNRPRPGLGAVMDTSGAVICALTSTGASLQEIAFYSSISSESINPIAIPGDTFAHLANCYDGVNKYSFVNGALINTIALAPGTPRTVRGYRIGGITVGSVFVNPAYVDELRFTPGVCRYTEPFSAPTQPFPRY